MANYTLLNTPITAAVSSTQTTGDVLDLAAQRGVLLVANFTGGTGGTSVTCYVQSSADGGSTWYDVASFVFANTAKIFAFNLRAQTPVTSEATLAAGALTANTSVDGILGDRLRVSWASVGTYSGTNLLITAVAR